ENILVNDESSNSESENTLKEQVKNPEEAIMETIKNIDKYNNNDQIIYEETISEYSTQSSFLQVTNYQYEGNLENWFLFENFD
ncbi:6473_t:CDS:1, partial [Cetraspora pellucida]